MRINKYPNLENLRLLFPQPRAECSSADTKCSQPAKRKQAERASLHDVLSSKGDMNISMRCLNHLTWEQYIMQKLALQKIIEAMNIDSASHKIIRTSKPPPINFQADAY